MRGKVGSSSFRYAASRSLQLAVAACLAPEDDTGGARGVAWRDAGGSDPFMAACVIAYD
jgi:hypothetical protein